MVATKNYAEYVKTAVKAGADLIISGAGLPVSLPEYVKGTATKIAPIVSSVKAATVICRMWDRKYQGPHRIWWSLRDLWRADIWDLTVRS